MSKYGKIIPLNPTLVSATNSRYYMQNAKKISPQALRMLRTLAFRLDDWAFFERHLLTPNSDGLRQTTGTYFDSLNVALRIEAREFKLKFKRERPKLVALKRFLEDKWKTYGGYVVNEYSRVTGEGWTLNRIPVYLVNDSLSTGLFRGDYLVLPYCENFDQAFCILVHLIARFVVTNKVLDSMEGYVGPYQDLYLDAIYGLLVNHVCLNITQTWAGFTAPIEPRGGREYGIFKALLPHWKAHLQRSGESFDTFLERIIVRDYVSVDAVVRPWS